MDSYTVYVANDGVEFTDMDRCLEYEKQTVINKIAQEVLAFDIDCKPLEDITEVNKIFYLVVKTNKAADIYWDLASGDYELPWGYGSTCCEIEPRAGKYLYHPECEKWFSLEQLEEMTKKLKNL